MKTEVYVLGTEYKISKLGFTEDPAFKEKDGYCDSYTKEIVYCDKTTDPLWKDEPADTVYEYEKQVLRHEIVHAFLSESGLDADSHTSKVGWPRDEEIIEWIAIQGSKLYKAWESVDVV